MNRTLVAVARVAHPYPIAPRVLQYHDPVEVIRHHDPGVEIHPLEPGYQRQPCLFHNGALAGQTHGIVVNRPENLQPR